MSDAGRAVFLENRIVDNKERAQVAERQNAVAHSHIVYFQLLKQGLVRFALSVAEL